MPVADIYVYLYSYASPFLSNVYPPLHCHLNIVTTYDLPTCEPFKLRWTVMQLFKHCDKSKLLASHVKFTYSGDLLQKFHLLSLHRQEKHTSKIQWSKAPSSMLRFLPSSSNSLHQIRLRHLLSAREIPSCNLRVDLYSGVGWDEMFCYSTSASSADESFKILKTYRGCHIV